MIPKKIHYVWVGGNPKSELVVKCLESWKKYMPDYEIVEWNESNFDIQAIPFVREAYDNKQWAFVSDVIRTFVLYEYGGVYLDTDLEIVRSPGQLFDEGTVLGFENKWLLEAHVLASEPKSKIFGKLLEDYKKENFVVDGKLNQKTITHRLSEIVFPYLNKTHLASGNYAFGELKIMDRAYFTAKDSVEPAVAIHHFRGSWQTKTRLTRFQWFMLRADLKILNFLFTFRSNIKTIEKENAIWDKALRKTAQNIEKNKKIYIDL